MKTWDEVYALFNKGGKYEGLWGMLDILRMANNGDRFLSSYGSNGSVVGTFNLNNGQLYLENNGNQALALPLLSSGNFDHSAVENFNPVFGWVRTATYIRSPSPHSTWRAEFNSSEVDWFGAGLDTAGIVADLLSFGLAGRLANVAQTAGKAGKIIGPVDLTYGIVQEVQQPSLVSTVGLASDVVGMYVPIGPDVFGLLLNFGNATHFYP